MPVRYGYEVYGGWGGGTDVVCECGSVSDLTVIGDRFVCRDAHKYERGTDEQFTSVLTLIHRLPRASFLPFARDVTTSDLL